MFNPFKKQELPTKLFITASLAALILLPVFFVFLKSILIKEKIITIREYVADNNIYDTNDPFITKVLSLKDIINGPITDGTDPSLGNKNAPVTIVEFSDFECEFCESQEKILKQIMEEYRDKVMLIWKDYPINNVLAPSYQSAIAARCAEEQSEFWPYHDILFEESHNLNKQTFMEIAEELNLNEKKFEKCLDSDEIKNLINDNIIEANALDINGIPFIFINKQEIMGEISLDELKKIIESELDK